MNKSFDLLDSICADLKTLGLTEMAHRLDILSASPQFLDMGPLAVLRDILNPEYDARISRSLDWRLRRAHLIGCGASLANCVDSVERTYSPVGIAEALSTLKFIDKGMNVCLLGGSGSGKTYFAQALGIQACHGKRAEYCHCDALIDELVTAHETRLDAYRKRMRSLIRVPLLILDDFLLYSTLDGEQHRVLFSLLEGRREAHASTIVCSQRSPEGWKLKLGDDAIAGAITTRVTRDYVVRIDLKTSEQD